MVACFRLGLVPLPCTEQLRAGDLELRLRVADPRLVVVDERNLATLESAGWDGPTLTAPWGPLPSAPVPPAADLDADDPCLITFTSGTAGEPKAVLHGQRYLAGQMLQARHWLDVRAGDLVWCTAASGWSKSARNAFVAPWLRGAAALAARRPLRSSRAGRDPRPRARGPAVHGADRVPGDGQARRPLQAARPAGGGRRRRAAGPRRARRLARGDQPVDPRRLRPDRDRPAHRHAARHPGPPGLDGHPPARHPARRRRRRAGRRPRRRSRPSSSAISERSRPRPARARSGGPATGSSATSRASCTSSAAPTT